MSQKINCEVHSCKYNGQENCICMLKNITIMPCRNCNSGKTDESKCGSYEARLSSFLLRKLGLYDII